MMPLLDEATDRRAFVRRLFAIGAGVAVGGGLIRQLELIVEPAPTRWGGVATYHDGRLSDGLIRRLKHEIEHERPAPNRLIVTKAMWDALLREEYVQASIVAAVNTASPFRAVMRRRRA